MAYIFCEKHKVRWNNEEAEACGICKYGYPGNNQYESTAQRKPYKKYQREEPQYKKINCETRDLEKFIAGLDPRYLFSRRRIKEHILYRKEVIKILHEQFGLRSVKIGKIMKLDHSTILSHLKRMKQQNEQKLTKTI